MKLPKKCLNIQNLITYTNISCFRANFNFAYGCSKVKGLLPRFSELQGFKIADPRFIDIYQRPHTKTRTVCYGVYYLFKLKVSCWFLFFRQKTLVNFFIHCTRRGKIEHFFGSFTYFRTPFQMSQNPLKCALSS